MTNAVTQIAITLLEGQWTILLDWAFKTLKETSEI